MNRLLAALPLFLLTASLALADSNDERHIAWTDLNTIVGKKVRIAMPDGTRIEGRAVGVEPDALTVQVTKTTNARAFAKGRILVPRANLQTFEISHPTYHWRVIAAFVGCLGGAIAGGVATFSASGAVVGLGAGAVAGYFLGRQADQRVTTYIVTQ